MARGTDMLGCCVRDGSSEGTTGKPGKLEVCCSVCCAFTDIGRVGFADLADVKLEMRVFSFWMTRSRW